MNPNLPLLVLLIALGLDIWAILKERTVCSVSLLLVIILLLTR